MARRTSVLVGIAMAVVTSLHAGCSAPLRPTTASDRTTPPKLGECYRLSPRDVARPSSATAPVPCTSAHTAQTFAIGTLPAGTGSAYDAAGHGAFVHARCQRAFEQFLGADESLTLRIQLSWAWFRPSERGWSAGARWYRCDVVGGTTAATAYAALPVTARGLFGARPPEQWLTCAAGPTVLRGRRLPCSQPHDWRAVTTIKLGGAADPYPGDRLVQVRSRDYCSDSVGAWANYPVDYEFGYTYFHEAEWRAGNRRSVCWARTDR